VVQIVFKIVPGLMMFGCSLKIRRVVFFWYMLNRTETF